MNPTKIYSSLRAMAADKNFDGVGKNDFYRVDPLIVEEEEGLNLRDYDDPDVIEHIEMWARVYASEDLMPPIRVRVEDGRIFVVEGHCRLRGIKLAIERGADSRRIDALPFTGDYVERVQMVLKSEKGLKLTQLNIALGYLRLSDQGLSNVEIARAQYVAPARVEQMLLLAKAGSDVHELVRSGVVTADVAIEVIREHRDGAGEFLRDAYVQAQALGKKRVTKGTLRGPSLPPKVVTTAVSAVRSAVAGFDESTRLRLASLETKSDDELSGQRVEVDALMLMNLVRAFAEIAEAEEKIAKRKKEKAQAASQQTFSDALEDQL